MNWTDLTGPKEIRPAGLDDVRCIYRAATRAAVAFNPVQAMFRMMLEPYFNPGKKLGRVAGHAIYRFGKLVPPYLASNMVVGGLVTLEGWLAIWETMTPKGPEGIAPVYGEPPQLPGV